ncbi:hypothetical protein R1flu_027274 [Riccia fluitans]|uniref:Uncharacterized protein n=1 Tax=Riccia fluitans TaxID=41844 RepID=A0ABD1XL99_9MARC
MKERTKPECVTDVDHKKRNRTQQSHVEASMNGTKGLIDDPDRTRTRMADVTVLGASRNLPPQQGPIDRRTDHQTNGAELVSNRTRNWNPRAEH